MKQLFTIILLLACSISFPYSNAAATAATLITTSPASASQVQAATNWYVAANGNDNNAGTLAAPFKTITKAVTTALAGDTIFVRGGNHPYLTPVSINKVGSASSYFYMFAFPGEKPVLDFSGMAVSSSNRGINLNGSYWHIKGLDFYKAGDNGMFVKGLYNIIEQCNFYENYDTGLQLGGGAAFNRIINCDSYNNADPGHGNADGFAPKLDVGTGNYFYGCRAWQNSDDGWDGYMRGNNDVTTTLENCWVFKSGYLKDGSVSKGNGNGFKMGGSDNRDLRHNMILINCLAFDNREKGFDQNNNKGDMTIYNGTAFNNGRNYVISLAVDNGKTVRVANSVSAGTGAVQLGAFVVQQTNSWMSGFSATAADFVSTDAAQAYGPRKPDGSLPDITFLHLRPGSNLIDRGTDVGLPFIGAAPDLGSFEFGSTPLSAPGTMAVTAHLKLETFPNPASGLVHLRFSAGRSGAATLKIMDITGRLVAVLHEGLLKAGDTTTAIFRTNALQPGLYIAVLENESEKVVTKLLLH